MDQRRIYCVCVCVSVCVCVWRRSHKNALHLLALYQGTPSTSTHIYTDKQSNANKICRIPDPPCIQGKRCLFLLVCCFPPQLLLPNQQRLIRHAILQYHFPLCMNLLLMPFAHPYGPWVHISMCVYRCPCSGSYPLADILFFLPSLNIHTYSTPPTKQQRHLNKRTRTHKHTRTTRRSPSFFYELAPTNTHRTHNKTYSYYRLPPEFQL